MDATLAPAKLVHLQSLSRASCRARYATTFEFSLTRSSFSVVAMPDGAAISSSVRPGAARVRSLGALATRGPAELGKYSGRKANLRSKLCTYEARTAFFLFLFFRARLESPPAEINTYRARARAAIIMINSMPVTEC